MRELEAAVAFAAAGDQALHMMPGSFAHMRKDTPGCFRRGGQIAHLFDTDLVRLVATARRLGVRIIKVERGGTPRQHIDLCGKPLERACVLCQQSTQ